MTDVFIDAGHGYIKAKVSGREFVFPHALVELGEGQWHAALKQFGDDAPLDYLAIGGRYYVVGEHAERMSRGDIRRTGAARYSKDYVGVFMARAVIELLPSHLLTNPLRVFTSYPPGYINFKSNLQKAIGGNWTVETRDTKYKFSVFDVYAQSEPVAGATLALSTLRVVIPPSTRLVMFDLGDGTSDMGGIEVLANGTARVDYSFAHSETVGIRQVTDQIYSDLLNDHPEKFIGGLPRIERIRASLRPAEDGNHYYRAGGEAINITTQVQRAKEILVRPVMSAFQSRGGGRYAFDGVMFTGGGSAAVFDVITREVGFADNSVILPTELNELHLANVRGLYVWGKQLERAGKLQPAPRPKPPTSKGKSR